MLLISIRIKLSERCNCASDQVLDEETAYDDEMEVVPLRLLKRSNQDQMEKLFNILRLLPDTIHW